MAENGIGKGQVGYFLTFRKKIFVLRSFRRDIELSKFSIVQLFCCILLYLTNSIFAVSPKSTKFVIFYTDKLAAKAKVFVLG